MRRATSGRAGTGTGTGSEETAASEDDSDLLAHGGRVQAAARAQAVEQAQAQQVKVVACLLVRVNSARGKRLTGWGTKASATERDSKEFRGIRKGTSSWDGMTLGI